MTIEDLFEADGKLRIAAREYSGAEHTAQGIEYRNKTRRDLRSAATAYAKIAALFEGKV